MKQQSDKLSSSKSIGFRPGSEFRGQIEALASESGWSVSNILRVGVVAYWPDITALVQSCGPVAPTDPSRLRTALKLCHDAERLGIDVSAVLTAAVEKKLTEEK